MIANNSTEIAMEALIFFFIEYHCFDDNYSVHYININPTFIFTLLFKVGAVIIRGSKLRHRERRCLPKVTQQVCGRTSIVCISRY